MPRPWRWRASTGLYDVFQEIACLHDQQAASTTRWNTRLDQIWANAQALALVEEAWQEECPSGEDGLCQRALKDSLFETADICALLALAHTLPHISSDPV